MTVCAKGTETPRQGPRTQNASPLPNKGCGLFSEDDKSLWTQGLQVQWSGTSPGTASPSLHLG